MLEYLLYSSVDIVGLSMPLPNSYCWYAQPSQGYLADLSAVVSKDIATVIPGFSKDNIADKHMTLALGAGNSAAPEAVARKTNTTVTNRPPFKKSVFMMPTKIFVSENGFVCIEFTPIEMHEQGDIKDIHNALNDLARSQGIHCQKKYSGTNYMPHMTIGKVKNVSDAQESLEFYYDAIMEKLTSIRVLVIHNIHLEYTDDNMQSKKLITGKNFGRRDFGLHIMHKHPTDETTFLQFNSTEGARKCAMFLYQFGKFTNAAATTPCGLVQDDGFVVDNDKLVKLNGLVNNLFFKP